MNDATYDHLRQKLDKPNVSCIPHDDFTAWIRGIQKASILQLGPEDAWLEDEASIQVRRMRARDLESQVNLPESEHEYEDYLDVIKLPLPIPIEEFAPQFLFIRPDEYALFKCFRTGNPRWCILTGNPGISKSWFQWKFILFCYRLDLYHKYSPSGKEDQVEKIKEDEESLLKGLQTEDQTSTQQAQAEPEELKEDEESFKKCKTENQTSTELDQAERKEPAKPFIPQLIVRTEAGCKSLLFFVDRVSDVLFVQHRPLHLKHFTDENSTILWEPASSNTPVCYSGVKAQIIVTVSPNYEEVFCHFENKTNATRFFMPCPSELQIQLMGQIYRRFATELEYCPTDAEIHQRVKKFGPFIPIALYWSRDQMDEFEES